MIKNSQSRIAKRRQEALVRRQANVTNYNALVADIQKDGAAESKKAILDGLLGRIATAQTDIENLAKKGIRP